ncbi:CHASE3 domain-containing protein, partial [Chryseobacterium sp. 2TAF14]|uniref:CHASE3 domain-containing protein n=1 Tax=Chryseobacterium sp. 2TAF14 TaxID=3233007 RepID=UPI003F91E5AD
SLLKSKESISLVKDILNFLLDAETGIRGYQLTGQKKFLEPYIKSAKKYPDLIASQSKLNINDKHQTKLLEELIHTSEIMMKGDVSLIENRKNGILMTPTQIQQKKTAMDKCRQLVMEFVKYEEAQLAIKNKDLNRSSNSTVLFIIFSAVAAVVVTFFFYKRLRSEIIRRDRLEGDLFYTKEMLEQTSTVAQVGGWEVNLENGNVFWSKSTREIHKVPDNFKPDFENAIGFFIENSREVITTLFNRAIADGTPFNEELQILRSDGIMIWVRVKGIPEFEGGSCIRVYGIIQDIDAFKKMFLEVTRKEAIMQSYATDVPVPLAMFDKDLNYISVSSKW